MASEVFGGRPYHHDWSCMSGARQKIIISHFNPKIGRKMFQWKVF
jgi:hypothetical protein